MASYRVDISEIVETLGGEIRVSDALQVDELRVGDERFDFLAPVSFNVTLTNTGAGIVADGSASAHVRAECCRCLEPFEMDLSGQVEGFYVRREHVAELPEEQEYELVRDNMVDLAPAIVTALTIEAPFAPLHDEECRGICPTCGSDLNLGPCDCRAPVDAESPFKALKKLLPEGEGADSSDAGESDEAGERRDGSTPDSGDADRG